MTAKLNFCLASRWLSPSNQGGVAMHNGYLANALNDEVCLHLISIQDEANKAFYENQGVHFYGVTPKLPKIAVRLARTNELKNGLRAWKDWLISLEMAKVLEQSPPDVVEFMDIHSEAYAFLKRNPARKRKTKVVIRSHTPWGVLRPTYFTHEIKGVDGWWAIQREQYCFKYCDAITTPSMDLKKQLIKVFGLPEEKITVIPNLLDTNHFCPLPKSQDQSFTFLHVGRFERAKGVITMTKAFIELCKETDVPVRLINVGVPRGTAYDQCINLLKASNLQDSVTFTGFVPYEDLPEYYAMADVVIVPPEIYESFSYTAAQAISCGKRVVASDSGGIPETLKFGDLGILFKKGGYHELVDAMKSIMYAPVSENEMNASATQTFGLSVLSKQFISYYYEF